jgi:energy-coupling factor transporter ATP-binding protein EcfA2
MIRGLRGLGKTILLTTHYLDEAQQLADRLAVLRAGEIGHDRDPVRAHLGSVTTEIRYRENGELHVLQTEEPTRLVHELAGRAPRRGPRAAGARGAACHARGRLPRARAGGRGVTLFAHQLARRPARVLAEPRERDLRLPLSVLLFLLLGTVYGGTYQGSLSSTTSWRA